MANQTNPYRYSFTVAAALFMFGGHFFGGGDGTKKVDVNVNAPAAAGKAVPGKSP